MSMSSAPNPGGPPPESPSALRNVWRLVLPPLGMMVAMGCALVLAIGPGLPWSRAALITALTALALLAVGMSLFGSMGLRREPLAIRLVILVPLALTLVITIVLMLDTHFRGPGLAGLAPV